MGLTTRALAGIAAAVAAVAVVARARRRREVDGVSRTGDFVPRSAARREALVDDAIDDSFPASDPPSYWGRETPS
jgi:hypothetical protein